MFLPPPQNPQSIGDLVGQAFRVFRQNALFVFRCLLFPSLLSALGSLGLRWCTSYSLNSQDLMPAILPLVSIALSSLLLLLWAQWTLALRNLCFVRMATGYSPTYESSYAYVRRKRWTVLAFYLLYWIVPTALAFLWAVELFASAWLLGAGTLFGTVALIGAILGLVGGLFGLAASLGLTSLATLIVFGVLACEDRPLLEILGRAIGLAIRDFWRGNAFLLLVLTALTAVFIALSLPLIVTSALEVYQGGTLAEATSQTPPWIMAFEEFWMAVVNIVLWPVLWVAGGLYYYDLRLRQEGLDIDRQIEGLEVKLGTTTM